MRSRALFLRLAARKRANKSFERKSRFAGLRPLVGTFGKLACHHPQVGVPLNSALCGLIDQGQSRMGVPKTKRKFSTNLFLLSVCILVALGAFEIVYIIFVFGLIPFLPESSMLTPLVFFIVVVLSAFSGFICFRWLSAYFYREYDGT
jgi:hypothetical protein